MKRDTVVFDLEELLDLGSWEALVEETRIRLQEQHEDEGEIDLLYVGEGGLGMITVDVEYSVNGGNNAS